MQCLNIRTSNLVLQTKSKMAKADPNMPEPTSKGEYKAPSANVYATQLEIKIDGRKTREALGIYTDAAFNKKMASDGKQKVLAGIGRRMREGRQARTSTTTGVFAQISKSKMIPPTKEIRVTALPAPDFTVIPSKVQGDIDPGVSKMQITAGKYKMDYTPPSVDISVDQYSSVRMWTSEDNYDTYA